MNAARFAPVVTILIASAFAACSSSGGDSPVSPAPGTDAGDAGAGSEAEATPSGPIALAAGEVVEVAVKDGTAAARLTNAGGEEYVIVLASTKLDSSTATYSYSVSLDAVSEDSGMKKLDGCSLAKWTGPSTPDDAEPTGTAPTVGTTKQIKVSSGIGAKTIDAKVAAVGKRAIVWVDTTSTIDAQFISEFLTDFDDTILPRERKLFGMESDLDGDGRISLVFTPVTKDTAVAFFTGCDLDEFNGCVATNAGEYLYLTPPADIDPPYNTPAAIRETLGHELGHLIHFNRKVLRNKLTSWPDATYMIEGFGGFAQDVVGYQAGNFYVAQAGLEQIDQFSLTDVVGTRQDTDATRDGLLRGGGYWFVRYFYDRAGGDKMTTAGVEDHGGPSFMRTLLDSPDAVAKKLAESASLADIAADFYTALAISHASVAGKHDPVNECFSYLPTETDPVTGKLRGGDPHVTFHGQTLTGPATKKATAPDKKLRAGGVDYLTVDNAAAGEQGISITVPDAAQARVRIARLK